jgi:hypothetical protein
MQWYHYFSAIWSGMFFANFVPHFVQGISGNAFPTPFARLKRKTLSSPTVNVAWALFNLIAGYILFRTACISPSNIFSLLFFLTGIACISLWLSKRFSQKPKV